MINYIGNKNKLSKFIFENTPKNPKIWCEPFGGMFGLYFRMKMKDYIDTQFVYNDINPLNSNLFDQLKNQKFIDKLSSTHVDEDMFHNSYDKLVFGNSEEKAIAWAIVLSCAPIRDPLSEVFQNDIRFEMFRWTLPFYNKVNRVTVENKDYKEIISKYDSEDTFFYLDPPYVGFENYYINHNFNKDSHYELSEVIKTIKGNWALSYFDFPEMKIWYSDYKIVSKRNGFNKEYLILKS